MDIIEKINIIKELNEEELDQFFTQQIQALEESQEKEPVIGYQINANPTSEILLKKDDEIGVDLRCVMNGFIPIGSKIVYGLVQKNNKYANNGMYYYVDTYDYILEFLKEIKTTDIQTIYELFDVMQDFILSYFDGVIDANIRSSLHTLFNKNADTFYQPTKEHVFSEFKGTGGGLCTEYSLVAQNILSFLGIETIYTIGLLKIDGSLPTWHAFNFVKYEGDDCKLDALVDFSRYIGIEDIDGNIEACSPYVYELEELSQDFLSDFISQKTTIVGYDYHDLSLENIVLRAYHKEKREYKIEGKLLEYIKK